jgi:hypothetical protein
VRDRRAPPPFRHRNGAGLVSYRAGPSDIMGPTAPKARRIAQAMLKMVKFNINELEQAFSAPK